MPSEIETMLDDYKTPHKKAMIPNKKCGSASTKKKYLFEVEHQKEL